MRLSKSLIWSPLAALFVGMIFAEPAAAVMRGEPARDPNGTRRSTVMVETPEGLCTGTVIGPDLVLTAGHCLAARGAYRVRYLDRSFRRVPLGVTRAAAHPNFNADHGFSADDVGLLQVARPFPNDIRPAALPSLAWTSTFLAGGERVGRELLIAGFGSTERRRARDGILREAIMRTTEPTVPGRAFSGLSGDEQVNRTGMCVGDSGGPVYERRSGAFTVVGILKGGTTDTGRECTSNPIFTSLGGYVSWIQGTAREWNTRIGATVEMRQ